MPQRQESKRFVMLKWRRERSVQTLLLLANVLALAVLTYIIYRIVSAARRRAEESRLATPDQQIPEQQIAMNLEASLEAEDRAPPPALPVHWEEGLPEAVAAPVVLAAESSHPAQPAIEEDLPYADPVDGMPFEPEESVVSCVCGLAYREDSVTWLADYHNGCCIHCGARVDLPNGRS
jgi:hypothetical protein